MWFVIVCYLTYWPITLFITSILHYLFYFFLILLLPYLIEFLLYLFFISLAKRSIVELWLRSPLVRY